MSQLLSSALAKTTKLAKGRHLQLLCNTSVRAFSTPSGDASSATSSAAQGAPSGPPKLVVLGGRGFVGSHVCQEAVSAGLSVVGMSRGGTPPLVQESWVDSVEWVRGNALEPQTLAPYLQGAHAVISCIGGFGTNQQMLKINGAANVSAIEAAKAAGVPRFVYISATIPNIPGIETLLEGYVRGKQTAEQALRTHFPSTGVALRPGVIYGDRVISASLTVPLGLAFQPLEMLLGKLGADKAQQLSGLPLLGAAFVPPVSVQAVARAAVQAAMGANVPGGVIDVWELASKYK
ncbi:hypothetical protein Agub_g1170 [Astrephomene gubernaculifera]|uniref:NAD(P)-binding domain-containing protein n=1 Tax=Astrephomene gubernaculifera TaxID=47775 RepID=A0AAD3DF10_9CHLO|nr:hypothetical protein Agub_g1170 [Astrephomene gubernaculifera]